MENSASLHYTEENLTASEIQEIQDGAAFLIKRYARNGEIWQSTISEIAKHPLERTMRLQKEFRCGDIMRNRILCKNCNTYAESKNRHDYSGCECQNVFADGGTHYLRRMCNSPEISYEECSVQWPWVTIIERESKNDVHHEKADDHSSASQEVAGEQE